MGSLAWARGRRLLALSDQHVSARQLAAHHREHVDALDLRRQRGRSHGTSAIRVILLQFLVVKDKAAYRRLSRDEYEMENPWISANYWRNYRCPPAISSGCSSSSLRSSPC